MAAVYADFLNALVTFIQESTTLENALIGSGILTTDHVLVRRYSCTSKDGPDGHGSHIQDGPMIYVLPGSREISPRSEQHAKEESVVEVEVITRSDDQADLISDHVEFVDDLAIEIVSGADGTGGAPSWASPYGGKVRISISQPDQLSIKEARSKLRVRAMLHPGV